jgi:hypothetical protein
VAVRIASEGVVMPIDLDLSEIRLILDIMGRTPVAGLETMRSVLLLAVKLQGHLPVIEDAV